MVSNDLINARVVECVTTSLAMAPDAEPLTESTELLGNLPEFDSQSVVTILTALEDEFEIIVEDDEVDASLFETIGSLVNFVVGKLQQTV